MKSDTSEWKRVPVGRRIVWMSGESGIGVDPEYGVVTARSHRKTRDIRTGENARHGFPHGVQAVTPDVGGALLHYRPAVRLLIRCISASGVPMIPGMKRNRPVITKVRAVGIDSG